MKIWPGQNPKPELLFLITDALPTEVSGRHSKQHNTPRQQLSKRHLIYFWNSSNLHQHHTGNNRLHNCTVSLFFYHTKSLSCIASDLVKSINYRNTLAYNSSTVSLMGTSIQFFYYLQHCIYFIDFIITK